MKKVNPELQRDPPESGVNQEPNHVAKVKAMLQAQPAPRKAKAQAKTPLALWVNGAEKMNFQGLEEHIKTMRRIYGGEIRELATRIQQHHTKTIKGNTYWYSKYNGGQTYHGKTDPRPGLQTKAIELADRMKVKEELMRSCVKKKLGRHLVIDLEVFKRQFKGSRADVIPVNDMLGGETDVQ